MRIPPQCLKEELHRYKNFLTWNISFRNIVRMNLNAYFHFFLIDNRFFEIFKKKNVVSYSHLQPYIGFVVCISRMPFVEFNEEFYYFHTMNTEIHNEEKIRTMYWCSPETPLNRPMYREIFYIKSQFTNSLDTLYFIVNKMQKCINNILQQIHVRKQYM